MTDAFDSEYRVLTVLCKVLQGMAYNSGKGFGNSKGSSGGYSEAPLAAGYGSTPITPTGLTQLFIRHLPPDMDENGVRNMFGKFGPIESVLFRGDGGALVFVRFQYPESAQDAINQMNNFTVPWPTGGPYTLLVEYAKPKLGRGGKGKGKGKGSFDNGDWESSTIPPSRAPRERSRSPYSGRWDDNIPGKGKGKGGGGGPRGLREATCLVHNLPESTTWEHLKNFFFNAGFTAAHVNMGTTPDDYPVGFVSFDSIEEMIEAMRQLSNSTMQAPNNPSASTSRIVYMEPDGMQRPTPGAFFKGIEQYVTKEDSPSGVPDNQQGADRCTVYCGGLAADVPAEELSAMFTPFGKIIRLDIKPPFYEWKGSYAFVLYDNAESAASAVTALDGLEMAGAPNGRIS
ncbi:RNA-binding protein, putative [Perkinsus marinus ATCC 50983]|uniref:RNA-binding protein, putative n=1 Tax=Perkinsus marinus (strain ATCC 50983 / TXsc) TaxID=423536 RepID=C5L6C9_PERM5|nr:RNA-binding protein, putative [Perkinsus marinus ATCC 50983]EER07756.1 RNA-binding protein, putative [Perkinsus marinus ATCC 50983]|eukprot:XP_002775940.1 RNA-binding protein, putative [Perkinsus marinus ATCC 50983]